MKRNLHNAYKYNNLPLKQKSNFLYGGILQITPNPAYFPMRYSTSTLSESKSGVLANACKIGPLADAMVQSTRSQEQTLPIELPLLLKIACISLKQVHIKKILLVSPF